MMNHLCMCHVRFEHDAITWHFYVMTMLHHFEVRGKRNVCAYIGYHPPQAIQTSTTSDTVALNSIKRTLISSCFDNRATIWNVFPCSMSYTECVITTTTLLFSSIFISFYDIGYVYICFYCYFSILNTIRLVIINGMSSHH